ncbi:sensor domain-containing diguanylate cyclase [Bacillus sp. FJAT-27245]|uniref:sensor domain-containing diguanylate cyclase n=1 Tax=Bacillus sp. FJAT-27245 TaxID=1684144 RepID=UPI0006A7AA19|nr:sensor domain-containing diguanylate cyclase [Bacillus sp. FJAT-27245]
MDLNDLKLLSGKRFLQNDKVDFPSIEFILDHLSSGFFILDKNWSVEYINKPMEYWIGKRLTELAGKNIWDEFPDMLDSNFAYFYNKAKTKKISITFEDYYERTKEWLKVTVEPYNGGIVGFVSNISEQKLSEQTIKDLVYYDAVTELPNRASFEETIDKFIYSAAQRIESLTLIIIQIEQLINFEDVYDYEAEKHIFRSIGSRILLQLDHRGYVARIRDNRFAVLLYGTTMETAEEFVNNLNESFQSTPFKVEDYNVYITANEGIAMYPLQGYDADELIKNAKMALAKAKECGCNHFFTYNKMDFAI